MRNLITRYFTAYAIRRINEWKIVAHNKEVQSKIDKKADEINRVNSAIRVAYRDQSFGKIAMHLMNLKAHKCNEFDELQKELQKLPHD